MPMSFLHTRISMTDDPPSKPVRYAFKPSVAGSPLTLELTAEGLSVRSGFRSDLWPYADIAQVRLSYRPVSMLAHRFRADIRHRNGRKIRIISATWAGIVALTPQNDSYRAFIEALHQRLAREGGDVEYVAGMPRIAFAVAAAAFAAVMIALAGLFLRALLSSQFVAVLFMLGFAAWFGWHTGGLLTRNKPRHYVPDSLPQQLLP
jgi:hypothetical protein